MQFSKLNQIVSALLNLIEFIAKLLCSAGQVVTGKGGARRQISKKIVCRFAICELKKTICVPTLGHLAKKFFYYHITLISGRGK